MGKYGDLLFTSLGTGSGIAVATIFILGTVAGVPLWFLVELNPMSTIDKKLEITVVPTSPTTKGESIEIIVNDFNGKPVPYVNVTITGPDGISFTELTDEKGYLSGLEYLGENTYVIAAKEGYRGDYTILPKIPDEWIRARDSAYASAIVSGVTSAALTWLFSYIKTRKTSKT